MAEHKELPMVTMQKITRNPDGVRLDELYVQVKDETAEKAGELANKLMKDLKAKK
jgi:hypothetical protein